MRHGGNIDRPLTEREHDDLTPEDDEDCEAPPPATPASPAAMERAREAHAAVNPEACGGLAGCDSCAIIARHLEAHTEAAVREAIERCADVAETTPIVRNEDGVFWWAGSRARIAEGIRALGKEGK